jgi:hypothetical protein
MLVSQNRLSFLIAYLDACRRFTIPRLHRVRQFHMYPVLVNWRLAYPIIWLHHWHACCFGSGFSGCPILAFVGALSPCFIRFVPQLAQFRSSTQNTLITLTLSFTILISVRRMSVSVHRFIPTVPPAQFGSVFTCSLMLTLYPSFEDRSKFKIPAPCVPYRKLHSSGTHPFMNIVYFVQL